MGFAPIPAVTEPPKLLGPPTVVLVQRTLDNPVDAHNHSTSSVYVSTFPRPRAFHPSLRYYNTSEERISGSELQ
jgi:nitrate reductase assembly molybdenum cofactor insertion protein NarJ